MVPRNIRQSLRTAQWALTLFGNLKRKINTPEKEKNVHRPPMAVFFHAVRGMLKYIIST